MSGLIISGQTSRAAFATASKAFAQAGYNVAEAKLTESALRVEALCNKTQSSYTFGLLVNQPSPGASAGSFNTEQKLNLQDGFVATSIGIFLAVPSSATDATFKLLSNPDKAIMTGTGTAAAGYGLYNGNLSISIDNTTLVPYWDLSRHLLIGYPNNTVTSTAGTSGSYFDGNVSGFAPVQPGIVLAGQKNLQLKINMPTAFAEVETYQRIVVVLRGHLAQNVGINKRFA